MRHRKGQRKLNRTEAHRKAMFRNMATSLFAHEGLETTLPKAKELRPVAEKLVTLAREDNLHRRRQAYSYLTSKEVVHKLFTEIGPRFKERPGGYLRIVRTRVRPGDATEMAYVEFLKEEYKTPGKKAAKKSAAKTAEKKSHAEETSSIAQSSEAEIENKAVESKEEAKQES
jgi:large subunit ribosomal protein L17